VARNRKQAAFIAAGLLVSVVAAGFFLYRIWEHRGDVGRALAEANYLYLIPSVGFIAVMYAFRVLRWRVFLRPIAEVPYGAIASATLIGFMSSCLLPLRPGEIIRPYVLHRRADVEFGHAAGTAMGLERVFDLIGVCFLLVLALVFMTGQEAGGADVSNFIEATKGKALWIAGAAAGGLACLLTTAFFPAPVLRTAQACLKVVPQKLRSPLMGFVSSMTQSMRFLRSPGQVAMGTLLSLAVWICFPLSTYSLARGFGMELTFGGVLFVQVVVTAAVAAPQAPGFIGVFQLAAEAATEALGVPRGEAGAFAIVLWAVNVVPITAVGLAVLWYEGLSVRGLARASKEAAQGREAESRPAR